jgi:hypothetical protein
MAPRVTGVLSTNEALHVPLVHAIPPGELDTELPAALPTRFTVRISNGSTVIGAEVTVSAAHEPPPPVDAMMLPVTDADPVLVSVTGTTMGLVAPAGISALLGLPENPT